MSSIPTRQLQIWQNSIAETLHPINGAFCIILHRTLMIEQTLAFLFENQLKWSESPNSDLINGFLSGMCFYNSNDNNKLFWAKNFETSDELFKFDPNRIFNAIKELEIHCDINLNYSQITYLADVGCGAELPLLTINRMSYQRGLSLEIEERGQIRHSFDLGDFEYTNRNIEVATRHYSTGLSLLSYEDQSDGIIEAAFMQFYLSIESITKSHKNKEAIQFCNKYSRNDISKIVEHVYLARHAFFGHSHPKNKDYGSSKVNTCFDITKQVLVAKWCARELITLELKRPLVIREMRFYNSLNQSIEFNGNVDSLETDFALPK